MDPLTLMAISGGLTAASNLGGSLITSGGQAAANSQNVAMQNLMNQQTLNAQQAQHGQQQSFVDQANQFTRRQFLDQADINHMEAEIARNFSAGMVRETNATQMAFQERMANTQYQRAMDDMKMAGLNPILAYKLGGNAAPAGAGGTASAPSASVSGGTGAMASGAGPPSLRAAHVVNSQESMGRAVGNIASSAMETLKTMAGIDQIRQSISESEARTSQTKEQTLTEPVKRAQLAMDTLKTSHEIDNIKANYDYIKAQTNATLMAAGLTAEQIRVFRKYDAPSSPGTWERILREMGIGMSGNAPNKPVVVDGKPLQLPEEAGWLQWLKRQMQK